MRETEDIDRLEFPLLHVCSIVRKEIFKMHLFALDLQSWMKVTNSNLAYCVN